MTTQLSSQLGLDFFGLSHDSAPIFKINVYEQIHFIVFNGNGGYTWDSVYKMPVWLRQWTVNKIYSHLKSQTENTDTLTADNIDQFNTKDIEKAAPKIKVPDFYKKMKK